MKVREIMTAVPTWKSINYFHNESEVVSKSLTLRKEGHKMLVRFAETKTSS